VNIIAKTGLGINEKYIMEKVGVALTVNLSSLLFGCGETGAL